MEHLILSVKDVVVLSKKERITYIKDELFIGYSRANAILNKLEDLLEHPSCLRMPNLLLVGDTNNGKTVLVNKFCRKHLPYIKNEDSLLVAPVIYVQAPPKPDEKRFYNNILDALASPYRLNDRTENKQRQVIEVLRNIKTKMLIIDEIHHILAGNLSAQRYFLNVIKYLANDLQIVIVGVGTRDAFNAVQTDPQMANRFEPAVLQKWEYNIEYARLLKSFESMLPLQKESNLAAKELAIRILNLSEGVIGEISTLLKKSAILAIEKGDEKISLSSLEECGYIKPSSRKFQ